MPQPPLSVSTEDPRVTVVTLDRPEKRNALSLELIQRLGEAVRGAADDPGRRVLILRANGPAFCAGLDLSEAAAGGAAGAERSAAALAGLYEALCASPLVTIAAARGGAFGGGAGLLLACDLVVAGQNLQVGFPEVRLGLVAALVTCLLRRQVGDRAARELILLGRSAAAPRALELGLISHVVTGGERLDEVVTGLAREACGGAPGAVARSKRLLDELAPRPIAEDLRRALAYHVGARNSAEAAEGMAAFLEKRPPKWGARL